MSIRCDACDAENPATSRYCSACGAALGARCTVCGEPLARGVRFCGACGAPIAASDEPTTRAPGRAPMGNGAAPPAATAERRFVSILFIDLVGSTALAQDRDPEETRDLLTQYFDACRAVIGRYGGTIEKFIGDAVMAVWGAPVAHEDDAERSVRAGIDAVAAVVGLGRELALEGLTARAAVVSGEAAVTLGAVGQGIVAGDVVNTASRLQTAARPGTVIVDEITYRAVRGSIIFERTGDRSLRGKRLPMPAWEARQVVALRYGQGRSVLPEAPLVGRDSVVAIVRDLLHVVRDDHSVRLLSIFGQAGVGKSRIVWELEKYVDGVVEKILWHEARSPAYGEGMAFWALAEMVRRRAAIHEADRPAVGRRRLAACLARFVPDTSERRWLTPHLAALIGLGPAPAGERDEAFAAWRTFFERVADAGTTVMVFDDLHWADSGLLDFIESFVAQARARPILVVTVARPDLLERRPGWGAGRRDYIGLHLEPLALPAMERLLTDLAPALPAGVRARILDRAAGIPLYAVEMVRTLVDRGALEAVGGGYQARTGLGKVDVPETLHALVAARLDGLAEPLRTLIHAAAVLGQAFPGAALASITGSSVDAIVPLLDRLTRQELLVIDQAAPAGDERYRFAEWLVREVAYGTLSLRDRRALHLAASHYYASLGDPDLVGAVASHQLAACRAGPALRAPTDLSTEAAAALRLAAARASAIHAPDQALAFIEDALTVTFDEQERAELWEEGAIFAQAAARLADAEGYARRALEWREAHGDRAGVARITARLGAILVFSYQSEASIVVARSALDAVEGDPALRDDPSLPALQAGLARAYLTSGQLGAAGEMADRAIATADGQGLRTVVAEAMATKGAASLEAGALAEGIGILRASLAMAEEHTLVVPALRARNSLAVGLLEDDPRAAFDVAGVGLDQARLIGFRDYAVRLASNWAQAAIDIGAWDAVLRMVEELDRDDLPQVDRVDFASMAGMILAWRGDPTGMERLDALGSATTLHDPIIDGTLSSRRCAAFLARGEPEAALAQGEAAERELAVLGLRTAFHEGAVPAARAALWAGDVERLERSLDAMARLGLEGRWIAAIRETLAAGHLGLIGEADASARRYRSAAAAWRDLDVPLQLGLCQLEAARSLAPDPTIRHGGHRGRRSASATPTETATDAAVEARAIFGRLGAAALLERLDHGLRAEAPAQPSFL